MLTRNFYPAVFRSGTRTWDPFGDLNRIQDEMNRLEGTRRPGATEYPSLNVWNSEDDVVVQAEVPGFAPEDIDVSVVQNTLTLRGSRKAEELKEGETYHRRERWTGKFVRSLELPFEVDNGTVEAEYKNGILSVKLPRAEEHKPKKITVKAS